MGYLELSKMEKEKTENKKKEEKKESEEKKNKKDKSFFYSTFAVISFLIVLGLTLLGIKIFSPPDINDITAEIIEKGKTEEGYLYNGFVFIYRDNLWHTKLQRGNELYNLHFHYSPEHVDQIPITGSLREDLDTSTFYITHDPLEENTSLIALASLELNLNMIKGMGVRTIPACYRNETKFEKNACENTPIITCDNTEKAVIFVKTGESEKITLDDNCIIIEGKGNGLLKSVDRVLFDFYGITNPKNS